MDQGISRLSRLPVISRISASMRPVHLARRFQETVALAALLLLGLSVRIWMAPKVSFLPDIVQFKYWGEEMARAPLSEFYRTAYPPSEILPGYLYVLAAIEHLRAWIAGPVSMLDDYVFWAKLVPIAADIGLGIIAFWLCRPFLGPVRSLIAAGLVLFNPGVAVASTVWAQADSLGMGLSMLAFGALVRGSPVAAGALGALAFVTKPQYTLFLAVGGVAYLGREFRHLSSLRGAKTKVAWFKWAFSQFLLPACSLVAALQLLLMPFSVSIWPGPHVQWTLRGLLMVATGKYPVTSFTAFNLWGTPIAGMELPDATRGFLSLSYQTWGLLLFLAVIAVSLFFTWTHTDDFPALLWASFVVSFGFFELTTRMHGRYLFPALPLLAVGSVFRRWMIPYYVALSALYLVDTWYSWELWVSGGKDMTFAGILDLATAASVFSVLLFLSSFMVTIVSMRRRNTSAAYSNSLRHTHGS